MRTLGTSISSEIVSPTYLSHLLCAKKAGSAKQSRGATGRARGGLRTTHLLVALICLASLCARWSAHRMTSCTKPSCCWAGLSYEPGVTQTGLRALMSSTTSEQVASKPIPLTAAGSTLESRRTSLQAVAMQFQTVAAGTESASFSRPRRRWGGGRRGGWGRTLAGRLLEDVLVAVIAPGGGRVGRLCDDVARGRDESCTSRAGAAARGEGERQRVRAGAWAGGECSHVDADVVLSGHGAVRGV